jgi:hypothetical protein
MRTIASTAKLAGRRLVSSRNPVSALVIGAAAALAPMSQASAEATQPTVEGVWRVTRHGVDCQTGALRSTFPAFMAFNKEGIVTGFAVPPGSSPALGSPEYGVWEREPGHGRYAFRLVSNNYDPSGTFIGTTEVAGHAIVAHGGNSLTYSATIRFLDVQGGLQFAVCGAASGNRFE